MKDMEFNFKKGVQIINYFAQLEGKSIDKLKILKLAWLADRVHLRRYGKLIVGDTYFAMKFGPVASGIKNIFDKNEEFLPNSAKKYIEEYLQKFAHRIKSKKEIDLSFFSESDLEVLKEVYDIFGNNHSSKLVDITHKYPEWTKFEKKLSNGDISQAQMNYLDFFENTTLQDPIFNISEENIELSKEMFIENRQFSNLFA